MATAIPTEQASTGQATGHGIGPRRTARGRGPETAAVGAVLVLAGLLRFWAIGRQGFWFDEAHTGWMLRNGLGTMLAGVPRTESTPPLYYAVAWFWVRVFGDTEVGLRSLSALVGLAAVPAGMATARVLAGRRAALICGVLLAVNPLLIWYAQEARAYSLLVLTSAVALWLFARALDRPSGPRLAGWATAAILALWTHYFAVFLVVPEALWLLRTPGLRPRLRAAICVTPAVASLPLVAMAAGQTQHAYWIPSIPLATRLRQVAEEFVVGFRPPATTTLALTGLGIAAVAVLLAVVRASPAERAGAALMAGVAATSLALPLLALVAGADYFDGRNVIATVMPLAVVTAIGLSAGRARLPGLGLAAALAALSIVCVARVWSDAGAQRPGWDRVAGVVGPARAPRAILLTGGSVSWAVPLAFYLRHTWWVPGRGARVRELDVITRLRAPAACDGRAWWGPVCNIAPHRVSRRSPIAGFRFVVRHDVAGFAVTRFESPTPRAVFPRRPFLPPRVARPTRRKRQLLLTPRSEPVIT